MNKKIVYIYLALIVIINVVGFFILPDELVMQVTTSGEANWSLAKPIALLFLFGLGIIGAVITLSRNDNNNKNYFLMVVIIVVHIVLFAFNL